MSHEAFGHCDRGRLVHTVLLKPTIKAQSSGRMASSGISGVVTASVYLEKTRLKKLMKLLLLLL